MIAVTMITCARKSDAVYGLERLFELEGEYSVYVNCEHDLLEPNRIVERFEGLHVSVPGVRASIDEWSWGTTSGNLWRPLPQFDQDQARLTPICIARNMCREFAMVTGASHMLMVDADVVIPKDSIPKLLELDWPIVGGLVPGRGDHRHAQYVFGEQRRWIVVPPEGSRYQVVECENGTCGFMMIRRDVFERIGFTWGTRYAPDGTPHMLSEDPAYCYDARREFGYMRIRMDLRAEHRGELKAEEAAQF